MMKLNHKCFVNHLHMTKWTTISYEFNDFFHYIWLVLNISSPYTSNGQSYCREENVFCTGPV